MMREVARLNFEGNPGHRGRKGHALGGSVLLLRARPSGDRLLALWLGLQRHPIGSASLSGRPSGPCSWSRYLRLSTWFGPFWCSDLAPPGIWL